MRRFAQFYMAASARHHDVWPFIEAAREMVGGPISLRVDRQPDGGYHFYAELAAPDVGLAFFQLGTD